MCREHGLHLLHPLLGTAVAVKGSEFTQKYASPHFDGMGVTEFWKSCSFPRSGMADSSQWGPA